MTYADDTTDDIQRRVDHIHTHTPRAAAPPDDLWVRVLAQTQTNAIQRKEPLVTSPTITVPATLATPPQRWTRALSTSLSLVASLAIVAILAFAGWFAIGQQGSQPGDRYAAAPGPANSTYAACDVDSLTVDEVMQIVENPYAWLYAHADAALAATSNLQMIAQEPLSEAAVLYPERSAFDAVNRTQPTVEQFAEAQDAIDQYIACLPFATNGQLWAMVDPVWVQQRILGSFPVYADEATVRAYVEEQINQPIPAELNWTQPFADAYGEVVITGNTTIEDAESVLMSDGFYVPVISTGVRVVGPDGEVVLLTDAGGYPVEFQAGGVQLRPVVTVGQSTTTGLWYVLPWLGQ